MHLLKLPLALLLATTAISAEQILPIKTMKTDAATLIDSNTVAAAFAKGGPLLENPDFKIQAGRRDAPGIVEIHLHDTDIFHILEGSATFVTGGTTLEQKTIGPGELRGTEIKGGESHHLSKGDVIIVPKGVPHWFKAVEGPLLYYVVKVTK